MKSEVRFWSIQLVPTSMYATCAAVAAAANCRDSEHFTDARIRTAPSVTRLQTVTKAKIYLLDLI